MTCVVDVVSPYSDVHADGGGEVGSILGECVCRWWKRIEDGLLKRV